MTKIFNELRDLYRDVQGGAEILSSHEKLRSLENEFYSVALSRQILFSDWYAHYKFFAQQQTDWIDEQKNFTWKDKVPLSLRILSISVMVGGVAIFILMIRSRSCTTP